MRSYSWADVDFAFPAATGVFYPLVISSEVAALAMSGSSALVAINALLLKRTQLERIRWPAERLSGSVVVEGVRA